MGDFYGDPPIIRRPNVAADCMQCGRLLVVTTVPVPLVRGATYQASDIPEDQLDKLRCSECARENGLLNEVRDDVDGRA